MPGLGPALRDDLAAALRERGAGELVAADSVGGGCINNGVVVETSAGERFFVKWNPRLGAEVFRAEADGLRALRTAAGGAVRIPEPLAWGGGSGKPGWLLLEHVAQGRAGPSYAEELGRGLAAIHGGSTDAAVKDAPPDARPSPDTPFGWPIDNWIGALPQSNEPRESWAEFWREERIAPQLEQARARGHLGDGEGRVMDDLLDAIPVALGNEAVRPALLHGDLWGGNAYADAEGAPVLIDPAVYVGHGEVDLAMTELFGGFGSGFYDAYAEAAGLADAYHAYRRDLYQLYYLLVHVNLFGASYVRGTLEAARRVLRALG